MEKAEEALGLVVKKYETDMARCGGTAGVSSLVAVVALLFGGLMAVETFSGAGSDAGVAGLLAGTILGVGLLCLWAGISCGWRYLTRKEESFLLQEGGVVYHHTGRRCAVPWDQITEVTDRGQDNPVSRLFGWDVMCSIRLRDGGRLLLTGFTRDAAELSSAVTRSVAERSRSQPPQDEC